VLKSEHKLVELDEDNGEPDEEDEDDIASATVEEFVESPSLETFLGLGEGKWNVTSFIGAHYLANENPRRRVACLVPVKTLLSLHLHAFISSYLL
jgi:hypothetical protein